jgi:N-acetylneuraminic acid mutarotase
MPEARIKAAACTVGNAIYVFGGKLRWDDLPSTSVYKFETEVNEWSTLAPMPKACYLRSATLLGGLIYIVGGGGNGRTVLCFDPESLAWSTLAPTSSCRRRAASFVLGGRLYVIGGGNQSSSSSMECYDVARNMWTDAASMLEGRRYFGAITIGLTGPAEEQDLFDSLIAKSLKWRIYKVRNRRNSTSV